MSEHSQLGASAAERWMQCPGSNVILNELDLPPTEESDFAKEGTGAHEGAAKCLRENLEAWQIMGETFNGFVCDTEMVDAIQLYLNSLAEVRAEHHLIVKELVEYRISGDFHPLFFGTVDDGIIGEEVLDVTDFKFGAGIAVDAHQNAQLMYYAVGILEKFLGPTRVRLRIVQPRAFHVEGPVRVWETTTEELLKWKNEKLIPAMRRAEFDLTLVPGDHCRFCPAKLACPVLTSIFGASVTADASALKTISSAGLARDYSLVDAAKHYTRALEAEVLRRLMKGEDVTDGTEDRTYKLVPKRANRVFTEEGVAEARKRFTDEEAYVVELKSPAQFDKLGDKGKAFTKEFAYTPQTGLTVAPLSDDRVGVKIASAAETFAHIATADNSAPPGKED